MVLDDGSRISERLLRRILVKLRPCRVCIGKRCPQFNIFDKSSGNVIICPRHPNPHGILMRRRSKFSPSFLRGVSR